MSSLKSTVKNHGVAGDGDTRRAALEALADQCGKIAVGCIEAHDMEDHIADALAAAESRLDAMREPRVGYDELAVLQGKYHEARREIDRLRVGKGEALLVVESTEVHAGRFKAERDAARVATDALRARCSRLEATLRSVSSLMNEGPDVEYDGLMPPGAWRVAANKAIAAALEDA